jgi:hypothetical protein
MVCHPAFAAVAPTEDFRVCVRIRSGLQQRIVVSGVEPAGRNQVSPARSRRRSAGQVRKSIESLQGRHVVTHTLQSARKDLITLQGLLEHAARLRSAQQRASTITTEGDEVQVPCLLITFESSRHRAKIHVVSAPRCDVGYRPVPTLSPEAGEKGGAPQVSMRAGRLGHPPVSKANCPVTSY